MSYVDAATTRLLATHCCCCGRPLVDAISVELGIGPECRAGKNEGITAEQQQVCNKLTHAAAVAAQEGNIEKVRMYADEIRSLGLVGLAEKVVHRFKNAERLAKITITSIDGKLMVATPFRRKESADFVAAWRQIPGRQYVRGKNLIPLTSKRELWKLLIRFFPGHFGKGPQGLFRIPKAEKNEAA